MARRSFEVDMCQGSVLKNTLLFAIPLIFSSILQLLYNAADLVVVSNFAGSTAMASVGTTGAVTNLIINIGVGFALGTSVVMAKKYGAKDNEGVSKTVHTSMLLSIVFGLFIAVVGFFLSKPMLRLLDVPKGEVFDGAVLYMQIIFLGVPGSMVYNFSASILRAIGDTKRPLYILAATGIVNVIINLILVVVFHLGVAGVAIGTIVANYLSAIFACLILVRVDGAYKLNIKKMKIYKKEFFEIAKFGIPAAIQSSFFSLSNSIMQSKINSFGANAISGIAAQSNIEGFLYVIANAFNHAAVTSVSQNYGAKNKKRINKCINVTMLCTVVTSVITGVLCVVFGKPLLGIYIKDSAEAIDFGMKKMVIAGLPYFCLGLMEVSTGAIRGLGHSTVTAVTTFIGTCLFRVVWATFGFAAFGTMDALLLAWPVSWLIVAVCNFITLAIVKPKAFKRLEVQNV